MPARHAMIRLLMGARRSELEALHATERSARQAKAAARARAQESLARHDTRPFASIDVAPRTKS